MATNPYEGLSDEAREKCVERMARTLTRKPRAHKTRLYIKSLSGRSETPDELRARARAVAKTIVDRASATSIDDPLIRRVRKDRVSPMADASQRRHPSKFCRRASRFQRHISSGQVRAPRDMQEMHNLRISLIAAQSDLCAICGHPMHGKASLDHVIPHAILGHHGNGNYVAAHSECNGDKTNDVPTGCEMVWLLAVNSKLGLHPQVF